MWMDENGLILVKLVGGGETSVRVGEGILW